MKGRDDLPGCSFEAPCTQAAQSTNLHSSWRKALGVDDSVLVASPSALANGVQGRNGSGYIFLSRCQ